MSLPNSIEVTGDSVEDAIAAGLRELEADPSQVIIEVLEEASRGVFGIGAHPARVRLQRLTPRLAEAPKPAAIAYDDHDLTDDEYQDDDSTFSEFTAVDEAEAATDAKVGKSVLLDLLNHMSIEATVTIRRGQSNQPNEDVPWMLDVSGPNLSRLIGRRGETLSSLQYITRLVASRELQRRANIIVDVDGYKSRRASSLRSLAGRMARQAIERKRIVTLEPMPPHERRIIHLTLRDHPDVMTRSVGEGNARKVTIVPK